MQTMARKTATRAGRCLMPNAQHNSLVIASGMPTNTTARKTRKMAHIMRLSAYAAAVVLASTCAVSAQTIGGQTSGPHWTPTGTVSSSSHSAGQSVGGLTAIPVARGGVNLSGWVNGFALASPGGNAGAYVVRLYNGSPAGGSYTCTDNVAFVDTAAAKALLIANPFTLTAAAPSQTTGDSATYASLASIAWPFAITSGTGVSIYACVIAGATDTADENNPLQLLATVSQN